MVEIFFPYPTTHDKPVPEITFLIAASKRFELARKTEVSLNES
jgi:hypothetical protein